MAKKKTLTTKQTSDNQPVKKVETAIPVEVPCPQHIDYMLKVERGDGILFAVCNCPVRGNMWKNRRVWERPAPDAAADIIEDTSVNNFEKGD